MHAPKVFSAFAELLNSLLRYFTAPNVYYVFTFVPIYSVNINKPHYYFTTPRLEYQTKKYYSTTQKTFFTVFQISPYFERTTLKDTSAKFT